MSKVLVIECGVAATRASIVEDGRATKFWFGPARGDENNDFSPQTGRQFVGRIKSVNKQLNAAFVDIGDDQDAFLPVHKEKKAALVEGNLVYTVVKFPPRQGKGAVLSFNDRNGNEAQNGFESGAQIPGRALPIEDSVIETVHAIGEDAQTIHIDNGNAKNILAATFPRRDIQYDDRPTPIFEEFGISEELSNALQRNVQLSNGIGLTFDEAQALTAIDVDSGSMTASSADRLREKMAIAAADEIIRQISLRGIGGHIVVDFPTLRERAARQRFQAHLKSALSRIDGAGSGSFSRSGLFSFSVPHRGRSLVERFTETDEVAPIPGRRFTLEWLAISLMVESEARLQKSARTKIEVGVGSELLTYLHTRASWFKRMADRHGQRFEFSAKEYLGARKSEIFEKRQ